MASCVANFCAKNYQNLIIGFHATVENVGDVFFGTQCIMLGNKGEPEFLLNIGTTASQTCNLQTHIKIKILLRHPLNKSSITKQNSNVTEKRTKQICSISTKTVNMM